MSYLDPLLEKKDDETIDQAIDRYNKLKGPGVYQIRVVNDDTFYIGASTRTKTRLETHLRELKDNKHHNKKLQESYNNSSDKVLEISILTVDDSKTAFAIEKELIINNKEFKNCANERNSTISTSIGKFVSNETKERLSKSLLNYNRNNSIKKPCNRTIPEVTKELMRRSSKEYQSRPEVLEKNRNMAIERMKDPNNREISRQGQKKQFSDEVYREKNKLINIERMKDPNNREISRQGAINQWRDPEMRERLIAARCKKITIDGVEYNSVKEATSILGYKKILEYRHFKKEMGENND